MQPKQLCSRRLLLLHVIRCFFGEIKICENKDDRCDQKENIVHTLADCAGIDP